MMISKPLGHVTIRVALGAVALLCWASVAKAVDSQVVFEKVKTSVVQVNIGKGSLGSGCVLDPKEGIIVTNFHVIEHAKGEKVTVAFPADGDGKTYPVEGYLEIVPTKDIALIRIDPSKRKLKPLKIAASLPSPGEHVYAFGSPLGLSLSFTEGPVSAIRTGKQVSDIADQMFGKGMYEKEQGYDFEATWVQHAAPISPGNSGGPLTNANGELLGLNTWHLTQGQNLNFAISAVNVQQVLSKASRVVKKFESLPPPRKRAPSGVGPGDMETTLATWKSFNRAMILFNKKNAEAEKKLEAVPMANPRNPLQGKTVRDRKRSEAYKAYASAYKEFASKVKALGSDRTVNFELIKWLVSEGEVLQQTGSSYQGLATAVLTDSAGGEVEAAKLAACRLALDKLRIGYDTLRISLSHVFNKQFPTIEETEAADASKKGKNSSGSKNKDTDAEKRFEIRTWTSSNGRFTIKAKLRSVDDENVKLEKEDGTVIVVPLSRLSEEDRRFLEETA